LRNIPGRVNTVMRSPASWEEILKASITEGNTGVSEPTPIIAVQVTEKMM
jgi:hypothetical protein